MNYIDFENLLGKHILTVEEKIGKNFENTLSDKNFYYIQNELIKKELYAMPYNCLTILTNENDTVQSISVHFREVINRQFYDSFNKDYGKPNSILVIENRKTISKTITKDKNGNIIQSLRKGEFDLREGNFEEKPLYIIWKKEDYQIKAFLRHKQNMSELTFSLPTTKL
ncbi:hypothetical protein [Winogradskyella sp.]|uniref:hypothetical protein n=1 Tax=Winogradskyella sp. TaxID=1883156 RepID=UPI003AB8E849